MHRSKPTTIMLLSVGIALACLLCSDAFAQSAATKKKGPQLKKTFPVISKFGGVVKLPYAAHQPRDGSRIVVDVTGGGEDDELFPSIEKVARYVNLYGGGGKTEAKARMVVILHGDATLAGLKPDAYAEKFGGEGNPNLECMRDLHEAGVEFYVCGQSLISKGARPGDTVKFVEVAVSAMTSLVNLQADGYAYIPLR